MKKIITWIFIFSCIVALLFLCLPLVLRFDCVYSFISDFLSAFRNAEHKGLYVETLGALFGAFLGVIGAVWAQNLANEQSISAEIEKNTQVVYADLRDSLDCVNRITNDDKFPKRKTDLNRAITQANETVLQDYEQLVNDNRIIMLPDWKQMVLSIEQTLKSEELRVLLVSYTELSELSSLVCDKNTDKRWMLDAYTVLTSINKKSPSLQPILEKLRSISQKRKKKREKERKRKNESGSIIS